jgi:muconolactone delta-isomerase
MSITMDQIQQLTPEQQETLASIDVQHAKTREQLWKQAGHYRRMSWLPDLVMGILFKLLENDKKEGDHDT